MINKPILRFPDFTNEWAMVSLNSISSQVARISDEGDYPVLTISAGNGFLEQKDRFSQVIAGNSLSKYTLLFKDELAYNRGNSKKFKYGCIYRLNDYDRALVPNVYISFRIEDGIPKFYEYLFQKKYLDRQLRQLISSSARMDGLLNISKSDFFNVKVPVTNKLEQKKIASFFSLIDKKIELQTEKVEELKNYKKGIMQKIFSQELRFKDENGDEYPEWEEKKLGNFIVEYKEKTTVENQYPVLTSSRSGLMFQTDYFKDRQVTTQDNIGYHIIPRGYITFRSRSDDTTFKFNQNNLIDKGIISYFYPVFCFNESLNDMYALYFMNNYLGCQIRREIVGTSQLVLSLNKLKELKIPVPCIEEQNKIGKLLDNLENKILQEQNKLNHFNRYKKGLLQQMFI